MPVVMAQSDAAPEAADARDAGPVAGVLLLLMSCLAVMGAVLLGPVVPLMVAHFAEIPAAAVLVPVALVVPGLCMAVASPAAGMLVDAVGRKRVLLWAFCAYAAGGVAPYWLDSLKLIIASRVVVGLAEAAVMTASTTLIADLYSGERRQTWLAWQTGVASLSAIVLIALGGALGAHGWRTPFLVYGLAFLFVPASVFILPNDAAPRRAAGSALHPLRAMRPIAWLCALSVVAGAGFYVIPIQLASVLTLRGIASPAIIGLAAAGGAAAVPVGSFLFGRVAPWGLTRVLALCFLLMGTGFIAIGAAHAFWPTLAGVVVASLGAGTVLPALLTTAASRLSPSLRGQGVGIWTASFFLGQFCSPLAVAGLNRAAGSLPATFAVLGAAFAVLGLLFATRVMRFEDANARATLSLG